MHIMRYIMPVLLALALAFPAIPALAAPSHSHRAWQTQKYQAYKYRKAKKAQKYRQAKRAQKYRQAKRAQQYRKAQYQKARAYRYHKPYYRSRR